MTVNGKMIDLNGAQWDDADLKALIAERDALAAKNVEPQLEQEAKDVPDPYADMRLQAWNNLYQTVKVLQTEELVTTATAKMMLFDLDWLKCLVDAPHDCPGDYCEACDKGGGE